MPDRVRIISKREIFRKFIFRIEETRLRHERFDGSMSDEIVRLNFNRGDSVAAIMHNPADDTILLIEQFRYPTYEKHTGWLWELPAGVIDDDDDSPAETMQRELIEETGYRAASMRHLHTFFLSPGGSSERIFLFYARVEGRIEEGGGLDDEDEDIKTEHVTVDEALAMMKHGEIVDAKTIIGLQWLQMNRNHLLED